MALAELQEEVVNWERQEQDATPASRGRSSTAHSGRFTSLPPLPGTVPSSPTFSRPSASSPELPVPDGRRSPESAKITIPPSSIDDKLRALRAYRKAKGLCFTCGERWGHGHVCAATVQLHVVEELVGMLTAPTSTAFPTPSKDTSDEELCLLSAAAVNGTEAPQAFRMLDSMKGKASSGSGLGSSQI